SPVKMPSKRRFKSQMTKLQSSILARATHDPKEQVPGKHAKSQRTWHRVAEESDLSDVVGNTPFGGGTCWKEDNVARPDSLFFSGFFVRNEGFAGEHNKGFVFVVMPGELPGSAIPDHRMRGAVMAPRQFLAAGLRRPIVNPVRRDRSRFEVDSGGVGDQDRFRHV